MSYLRLFLALVMAGAWLPAEHHGFHVIILDEVSGKGRGAVKVIGMWYVGTLY